MYGNYQVGLAVPQIHLNDGNAAIIAIQPSNSYSYLWPQIVIRTLVANGKLS